MKLENVQIEIKNKEHYEAVKKRLQELGKVFHLEVDGYVCAENYKIRFYVSTNKCVQWNPQSSENHPNFPLVTLDDLYEVKKEKVIKHKFRVIGCDVGFNKPSCFDSYEEAVDFINKQESGRYEIKKLYEVVEE